MKQLVRSIVEALFRKRVCLCLCIESDHRELTVCYSATQREFMFVCLLNSMSIYIGRAVACFFQTSLTMFIATSGRLQHT